MEHRGMSPDPAARARQLAALRPWVSGDPRLGEARARASRRRGLGRHVLEALQRYHTWTLADLEALDAADKRLLAWHDRVAVRAMLEGWEPGSRGREALHRLLERVLGLPKATVEAHVDVTSRVVIVPCSDWAQVRAMYAAPALPLAEPGPGTAGAVCPRCGAPVTADTAAGCCCRSCGWAAAALPPVPARPPDEHM